MPECPPSWAIQGRREALGRPLAVGLHLGCPICLVGSHSGKLAGRLMTGGRRVRNRYSQHVTARECGTSVRDLYSRAKEASQPSVAWWIAVGGSNRQGELSDLTTRIAPG